MSDTKDWLAEKAKKDRQLYEQYGRPLEKEHEGDCLAIGPDGQTILGENDVEVLRQAIDTFGSGNFAFVRVGRRTFGQWLSSAQ